MIQILVSYSKYVYTGNDLKNEDVQVLLTLQDNKEYDIAG
jgi:hypothetical protein